MKKAIVTGASSGIGSEISYKLSERGYELIIVSRRIDRLEEVASKCKTKCTIMQCDLSNEKEVYDLFDKLKSDNEIEILVNNAGFGLFGKFTDTPLDKELEMIDLNIRAVHILTKLFLDVFKKKDRGYILNVASSASFLPGPLMSTYYATKAFVQRLSLAVSEELRRDDSKVYIGAFCPGPVDTEFNDVANVRFSIKGITSSYAAECAIDEMFKRKKLIIPKNLWFLRLIPMNTILKISYRIQKQKD